MAITFLRLKEYLDKIAEKGNRDAANSAHGLFWDTTYSKFIAENVPNKRCNGQAVPIINQQDKTQSAFYQILKGAWCNMPQMPRTGPFVTDPGYSLTLGDGTIISGQKLLDDIHEWLAAGAPENG